jgi:hypothetical protein
MTTPRRRVLRPASPSATDLDRRNAAAIRRRETKLTGDQISLRRWMKRLKRAFTAVDKLQLRINRTEKQIALLRQV